MTAFHLWPYFIYLKVLFRSMSKIVFRIEIHMTFLGTVHSRCQIQPEYYISVDFCVNESHYQRHQFFNIDALGKGGYGKLNPCVDFVPEHDGPQIVVAMNGVKNRKFNFPNCELYQWYNLTISQEEINENKYKFTATVTELADEGDNEFEGKFKSDIACSATSITKAPMRDGLFLIIF